MDAIILAGGKGTRLASVITDVPKPLAPVGGRPFLDYLLEMLAASGVVKRAILSIGHQAERVIEHYTRNPAPLPLQFITEEAPLGTGGAILHCLQTAIQSPSFFALNGDSLVACDFKAMKSLHERPGHPGVLLLTQVPDQSRFGTVLTEGENVTGFLEKRPGNTPGMINAGIYLFHRSDLEPTPVKPCSLERDLLPPLIESGRLLALKSPGPFIDIGLPETYALAADFVAGFRGR